MAIATRDAAPSHLLLKIEYVSLHDECQVDMYESPKFVARDYKWKIRIYPNGHGTERAGDNVSVYLAISGTDDLPENWEVNAVFSIFILNQISGNYHHTIGHTRRFFRLKTEWGVASFMSKEGIMNPSNGFLIDDCCVFGAEVFVIDNSKPVTRCLSLREGQVPYKHAIKISDLSTLEGKEVWYSEEFTAGDYKWKILLYPNESADEAGRRLSVYLEYVPLNNKTIDHGRVNARYAICMRNQLDSIKNCGYSCSHWFDASSTNWGWASFVLLDELNAADGGFIVKDTCLFEIEISVLAAAK